MPNTKLERLRVAVTGGTSGLLESTCEDPHGIQTKLWKRSS
jgi:hypothetical protein